MTRSEWIYKLEHEACPELRAPEQTKNRWGEPNERRRHSREVSDAQPAAEAGGEDEQTAWPADRRLTGFGAVLLAAEAVFVGVLLPLALLVRLLRDADLGRVVPLRVGLDQDRTKDLCLHEEDTVIHQLLIGLALGVGVIGLAGLVLDLPLKNQGPDLILLKNQGGLGPGHGEGHQVHHGGHHRSGACGGVIS